MPVNAVTMPPISDPLVLSYLRLFNTDAPTPELQEQRDALRKQIGKFLANSREHFQKCDAQRMDNLLAERETVGTEAKAILRQIDGMQQVSGRHSSHQPGLQDKLTAAQTALREFQPVNRTVASFKQIEQNEVEEDKLRQAVDQAKQAISLNLEGLVRTDANLRELTETYRQLESREQAIVAEIEQLKLPPDQRRKRSSIVWQDASTGSTFAWEPSA
jgi:hypothetical protein